MSTPKLPNITNSLQSPGRIGFDTSHKFPSQFSTLQSKKDSRPPSTRAMRATPKRLLIEDDNYKTYTNPMVSERSPMPPNNKPYQPVIRHQKNDSIATATSTERQFFDSKMYTLSEFAFMNVKEMNINTDLDFEDLGIIKTMHRSTRSYSDNMKLLNESEMRRIPFTRKNYMTKEQMEINKRLHERFHNQDKGLETVKAIKEFQKDTLELTGEKRQLYKINCSSKIFPITFNIRVEQGEFELWVSSKSTYPDVNNHDYYFTTPSFSVDYPPTTEMVYVTVAPTSTKLKAHVSFHFASLKRTKKDIDYVIKKSPKKKKAPLNFEFPGYDTFEEMRHTIGNFSNSFSSVEEILKSKRAKILARAGNKDLVKLNAYSARNYGQTIQLKPAILKEEREFKFQHVIEKKQANEQDRKVKGIYTMVRKDLNHVLRKWKEEETQKFQEKQLFQVNWLIILASVRMMKQILEKKIEHRTAKILKGVREMKAKKIVKYTRNYLRRPCSCINNGKLYESGEPDIRLKINMIEYLNHSSITHRALNAIALICVKPKTKRANLVIWKHFVDVLNPLRIRQKLDLTIKEVVKIQRSWKKTLQIIEARIKMFMGWWSGYCLEVMEEERRKKKTTLTDWIFLINEKDVLKYAKKYIMAKTMEKTEEVINRAEGGANRRGSVFMKSLLQPSKEPETTKKKKNGPTKSTGDVKVSKPAGDKTTEKAAPPKLKFHPTKEEFRALLDNFIAILQIRGTHP